MPITMMMSRSNVTDGRLENPSGSLCGVAPSMSVKKKNPFYLIGGAFTASIVWRAGVGERAKQGAADAATHCLASR